MTSKAKKADRRKAPQRRPQSRVPKMLRHSSGQARVILSGKVHYLGVFGSPEAHSRYGQLLREWEKSGRQPIQPALTVVEASYRVRDLIADYKRYLDESGRYRKNGEQTSQRTLIDVALQGFEDFAGDVLVRRVGEATLVQYRDRLEGNDRLTRSGINRKVALIRQAFRWGRQRGHVPRDVWLSLSAVEPLGRAECGSRPGKRPKRAVTQKEVEKVAKHAPAPVAAMLRLQALTSMRPGEACAMRWADIDKDGPVIDGAQYWIYRVSTAKTAHHQETQDDETVYPLGPQAQVLLSAFPKPPAAYIFSPRDAEAERSRTRRQVRKTPVTDYTLKRDAQATRVFAERYSVADYRQAVERACRKAKVQRFTPHEVRHGALTWLANHQSAALAQAAGNHRKITTTAGYVHRDLKLSFAAAAALQGRTG